jgi:hypothetical protein
MSWSHDVYVDGEPLKIGSLVQYTRNETLAVTKAINQPPCPPSAKGQQALLKPFIRRRGRKSDNPIQTLEFRCRGSYKCPTKKETKEGSKPRDAFSFQVGCNKLRVMIRWPDNDTDYGEVCELNIIHENHPDPRVVAPNAQAATLSKVMLFLVLTYYFLYTNTCTVFRIQESRSFRLSSPSLATQLNFIGQLVRRSPNNLPGRNC